jgi:hypothetical protein
MMRKMPTKLGNFYSTSNEHMTFEIFYLCYFNDVQMFNSNTGKLQSIEYIITANHSY